MKRGISSLLWCVFLLIPTLTSAGQLGQGGGSSYPSALDTKTTYTNKAGGSCTTSISSNICKETFNDPQDAIVKIETELGLLPKGSFATVVARLNAGVYIGTAGASLTAAAGGLVYSTSTALAVQAAGTSGSFARSGGTGAPTWFDLFGTANTFTATQTISNTAPSLVLTDTTASAKSLTIAVDANLADLRESAGASGSLLALDLGNNRVGIGTASPGANLTVRGTSAAPPSSGTSSTAISRIFGSNGVALDFGSAFASPYGLWIQGTDPTNFATNYPITLNPNGGNVGIGTTSPNVGLEMGSSLDVRIPHIKSTTGTRYICVDTNGTLVSQAASCVGT